MRVRKLLLEVGITPAAGRISSTYGNVAALDADTAALCAWCKAHDVTAQSLELQIWWRDHQRADARKAAERIEAEHEAAQREAALAKLTDAERRLLGVEP